MENPLVAAYNFLNKGGPAMYGLVFCSILMFSIVVERFLALRQLLGNPRQVTEEIRPILRRGCFDEAVGRLRKKEGIFPEVLREGIIRNKLDQENIETAMANTIITDTPLLEGMVGGLGTIAVIAPFLGLLGTITGLINAFNQIALRGTTGPAVIATGIYEALYTTAAGLVIAIPAVVFYNYFRQRISGAIREMEVASNQVVEMILLGREGREFPGEENSSPEDEPDRKAES